MDRFEPGFIKRYGALTYLALLVNTSSYLYQVQFSGVLSVAFALAVLVTYDLLFVLAALLPAAGAVRVIEMRLLDGLFARLPRLRKGLAFALPLLAGTALQLLLYMDAFLYSLLNHHFDGFILNVVFTSRGMESMGAGSATYLSAAWLVLGFLALQTGLLALAVRSARLRNLWNAWMTRRVAWTLVALFVLAGVFERTTFALSKLNDYNPVVTVAPAMPFYIPMTFRRLAKEMGFNAKRKHAYKMKSSYLGLNYPAKPLAIAPGAKRPNIVWLSCESLRADMLDPEIMPATWKLAQESVWCTNHYSGGNGTRMGVFAMFYGLYGNYWFPFLAEQRSPVLVDALLDRGYQMELCTSASFNSPEFNRTIWSRIPQAQLHEDGTGLGWERDRQNVQRIEDFLDARKKQDPFFVFMFFESPHARYYFPPESVIRPEYTEEIDYLKMDLAKDIGGMKNRYINACHHLDSQIQRLLEYLRANRLMEDTIVLVTGDHGEAFMEHGRWGHGSDFSDEQTHVPLVLWIPGQAPRKVTKLTSHMDLPATILAQMGARNPSSDYSEGLDILGKEARSYSIIANWNNLVYIDPEYKAIFPTNAWELAGQDVRTRDYREIENPDTFYESRQATLLKVMREMNRFAR